MHILDFLTLERPLVWVDVETHDKCSPEKAHICELGLIVFYPDKPSYEWGGYVKPPKSIRAGATGVHGITNEKVEKAHSFQAIAAKLFAGMTNANGTVDVDFGGYNVRFDLRVLAAEFQRCGLNFDYSKSFLFDPLKVWQVLQTRKLADAVREFCGREPTDSHRALADTQDALDAGIGQFKRWPDRLPRTMRGIHELCFVDKEHLDPDRRFKWLDGKVCFAFGKFADHPIETQKGYLNWMLGGDFSLEVRTIASNALKGIFPEPPATTGVSNASTEET